MDVKFTENITKWEEDKMEVKKLNVEKNNKPSAWEKDTSWKLKWVLIGKSENTKPNCRTRAQKLLQETLEEHKRQKIKKWFLRITRRK